VAAKILIADDNQAMREAIIRFVEAEGYTALAARNGREALALALEKQPDLVLLDVTMPDIDGFEVCRRLKNDPRTALIPITMLTVLDSPDHRRYGIEAGADDFLTKPFDERLLRARIQSQLRTKRLTDQLERTESVIVALALAVEAKDMYTEGHLWRLAHYGEQLAIAAGLRRRSQPRGMAGRVVARHRQNRCGGRHFAKAGAVDAGGVCAGQATS